MDYNRAVKIKNGKKSPLLFQINLKFYGIPCYF